MPFRLALCLQVSDCSTEKEAGVAPMRAEPISLGIKSSSEVVWARMMVITVATRMRRTKSMVDQRQQW